jgi:ribosomal protein S18 acetylase RimI-like enzyme
MIRKASESDVESILRILAQLDGSNEKSLTVDEAIRILRRMASYPDYGVYVAECADGQVVGAFALMVMDNLAHQGAPSAIVEDVCVDMSTRRQGVGRIMLEFAMKHAREKGCYKLALSSNSARTSAHDFYRSLGFSQHGVSFYVDLGHSAEAGQHCAAEDEAVPGH